MAGAMDTITLAAVLVLAIPAALAGLELLLVRGEHLAGGVLLVGAVALVLVKRHLTLPTDVPGLLVSRIFGRVLPDSESDAEEE